MYHETEALVSPMSLLSHGYGTARRGAVPRFAEIAEAIERRARASVATATVRGWKRPVMTNNKAASRGGGYERQRSMMLSGDGGNC